MNPSFQLIDTGWDKVIHEAATADRTELRVVCPFIKVRAAKRLLAGKRPEKIQVITRFHLGDMCDGVSDTEALRLLLENGAKIRGVRNLHAKLYLFGDQRAIVTSANLTEAALLRNHEFGFVSSETGIITRCREYFDVLWKKAGPDLDQARLNRWVEQVMKVKLRGSSPRASAGLPDEGVDAGFTASSVSVLPRVAEAPQSFVKFFGEGTNRAQVVMTVLDEVDRSGCHWACSYPKNKRPRSVEDGAVMFMGRLVADPNDTIIFGRAIGIVHVEDRDVASSEEINKRPWKRDWPMYIRVHHGEFLAGTLANGVRLSELMDELGSDSFASTQRNAHNGSGNTDPRAAFKQQAQVELTAQAFGWLNERLESAFRAHGSLAPAELERLDQPTQPVSAPLASGKSKGRSGKAREFNLSANARAMLGFLIGWMLKPQFDAADPSTFPTYSETLESLGIEPWDAPLGTQFFRAGSGDLNKWLMDSHLPALTGLVVNKANRQPGGDYFRSNGRKPEDFQWWLDEIERAAAFDWSPYISDSE